MTPCRDNTISPAEREAEQQLLVRHNRGFIKMGILSVRKKISSQDKAS